ncbi:hypothetical protein JCM24511_08606 [Saitozyma sp. JCM 24511]|nr:hypothetical protein JCM24511_08606 [Saitozyma sp. JCM 24511]
MSFFSDDEDDPSYPLDPNARPPRPGAGVNRTRQPSVLSTASMSLTHDPDTSSSIQGSSRNPLGGGGGGGDRGARDRSRSSISHLSATASPGRSYVGMSVDDDSDMASLAGPGLGPSGAGRPRRGEGDGGGVDSEIGTELDFDLDEDEELDDVRRMGRVWVRERGTVEIQQWEGDLIDSLLDKLEQQQKMVVTLRSDPATSEEEHFKLVLVQTEMERVKYLVRSYVRCRLSKIEKYSHHIVLTPELHPLLSGAELSHAKRYTELLHTHFQHSVLDSLPEWLRKMDDSYGDGLSMVVKPNKDVPVLIFCRKYCGEITLEGGERAELARGTTHLVRYHLVEQWVKLSWAEVL